MYSFLSLAFRYDLVVAYGENELSSEPTPALLFADELDKRGHQHYDYINVKEDISLDAVRASRNGVVAFIDRGFVGAKSKKVWKAGRLRGQRIMVAVLLDDLKSIPLEPADGEDDDSCMSKDVYVDLRNVPVVQWDPKKQSTGELYEAIFAKIKAEIPKAGKMKSMLDACTSALKLKRPAKRLFFEGGGEVCDPASVFPCHTLHASTGGPYKASDTECDLLKAQMRGLENELELVRQLSGKLEEEKLDLPTTMFLNFQGYKDKRKTMPTARNVDDDKCSATVTIDQVGVTSPFECTSVPLAAESKTLLVKVAWKGLNTQQAYEREALAGRSMPLPLVDFGVVLFKAGGREIIDVISFNNSDPDSSLAKLYADNHADNSIAANGESDAEVVNSNEATVSGYRFVQPKEGCKNVAFGCQLERVRADGASTPAWQLTQDVLVDLPGLIADDANVGSFAVYACTNAIGDVDTDDVMDDDSTVVEVSAQTSTHRTMAEQIAQEGCAPNLDADYNGTNHFVGDNAGINRTLAKTLIENPNTIQIIATGSRNQGGWGLCQTAINCGSSAAIVSQLKGELCVDEGHAMHGKGYPLYPGAGVPAAWEDVLRRKLRVPATNFLPVPFKIVAENATGKMSANINWTGSMLQTPLVRGGKAIYRGVWHSEDIDNSQRDVFQRHIDAKNGGSISLLIGRQLKEEVDNCTPVLGVFDDSPTGGDTETFATLITQHGLSLEGYENEGRSYDNWDKHLALGWPWRLPLEQRISPNIFGFGSCMFNPWLAAIHNLEKMTNPVPTDERGWNEHGQSLRSSVTGSARFSAFVRRNGDAASEAPVMVTEVRQRRTNEKEDNRLQLFLDEVSAAFSLCPPAKALYTIDGKRVRMKGNEIVVPKTKKQDIRPHLWVTQGNAPFSKPGKPNSAYNTFRAKMLRKKEHIPRMQQIAQPKMPATIRVWARWNGHVPGLVQTVMCRGDDMVTLVESCTATLPSRGRKIQVLWTEKGEVVKSFLDLTPECVVWCGFKGESFLVPGEKPPTADIEPGPDGLRPGGPKLSETLLKQAARLSTRKEFGLGKADRSMQVHMAWVEPNPAAVDATRLFDFDGTDLATTDLTTFMVEAKINRNVAEDQRRILDGQTRFFT